MNLEKDNTDKQMLRSFGLITGAIISALFGLFLPWVFNYDLPYWPWIITGILWGWAMLSPSTLMPVYRIWMKVGYGLGWINSRIILGVMFYVIFLPSGLIMRLAGKDPMKRTLDKNQESYRIHHPERTKDHVERPF